MVSTGWATSTAISPAVRPETEETAVLRSGKKYRYMGKGLGWAAENQKK